jgi:GNAT superfamily N-acetyltransferase
MIQIRKAVSTDVDVLWRMGANVKEFEVNSETVNFWPKNFLAKAISENDCIVLVAEESENSAGIHGFTIVNLNRSLGKAIIENMYVHEDMRNQGIATQLITFLVELLKQENIGYLITLIDEPDIAAEKFYTKNTFAKGIKCIWLDKIIDEQFKR